MKKTYKKPSIYVKELMIESMLQGNSITTPNSTKFIQEENRLKPFSSGNPGFFSKPEEGGGAVQGEYELDF